MSRTKSPEVRKAARALSANPMNPKVLQMINRQNHIFTALVAHEVGCKELERLGLLFLQDVSKIAIAASREDVTTASDVAERSPATLNELAQIIRNRAPDSDGDFYIQYSRPDSTQLGWSYGNDGTEVDYFLQDVQVGNGNWKVDAHLLTISQAVGSVALACIPPSMIYPAKQRSSYRQVRIAMSSTTTVIDDGWCRDLAEGNPTTHPLVLMNGAAELAGMLVSEMHPLTIVPAYTSFSVVQ